MKRILICLTILLWFGAHATAQTCNPPECKPAPMAFEAHLGPGVYPVIFVSHVFERSNAEAAGLRSGDVILAVNGKFQRYYGGESTFMGRMREYALYNRALVEVQSALPTEVGQSRDGRSLQLLLSSPEDKLGFAYNQAYYVSTVRSGSLAEQIGLRAGDFIHGFKPAIGPENPVGSDVLRFDTIFEEWLTAPFGSLVVYRLKTAEAGRTTWEAREITLNASPLDGPVPPPGATHDPKIKNK